MTTETLAPDVGWEPSGHLSEIALSAAADGEDTLLDAVMRAHLDACDACATRLGEVAFRSASVAGAFATLAAARDAAAVPDAAAAPELAAAPVVEIVPARVSAAPVSPRTAALRARRRVPVGALAAAALVAALGLVPQILVAPAQLQQSLAILRKVAPSMIRLFPQAVARAWSGQIAATAVVTWTLALVLVAAGLTIARKASKNMALNGGRQ